MLKVMRTRDQINPTLFPQRVKDKFKLLLPVPAPCSLHLCRLINAGVKRGFEALVVLLLVEIWGKATRKLLGSVDIGHSLVSVLISLRGSLVAGGRLTPFCTLTTVPCSVYCYPP